MLAVGTGYVLVVASSWETIVCAFARPAELVPLLLAEAEELAAEDAAGELTDVLEDELELQAASTAAAVSAAPGASQRFHLCVIALCLPYHTNLAKREIHRTTAYWITLRLCSVLYVTARKLRVHHS
jgi:hypothetical protein